MLDLILTVTSLIFIFLFFQTRAELNKLKKHLHPYKNRKNDSQEENKEFSIGLTKLTGEFTGKIPLDPLTNLPGREAFESRLSQTLEQSKRFEKSFGLILLDVNQFKVVNNTEGYESGDKLLIKISERLQNSIRQIDTVSRYAGNTFIFLLPQLALAETAAYVAQRLLDNMVQPFEVDNKKIGLTANVGVAIFPVDGNDEKTLVNNANNALQQAKASGRSKYQFYHQELHALGQRELSIRSYLNSDNIFEKAEMHYQPYVNITNEEVELVQAVLYLNLPDVGLVAFNEFAHIAENAKKSIELGEWTLRKSLYQFKQWIDKGFNPKKLLTYFTVSQIENTEFIFKVSKMLAEFSIHPHQLIVEITEPNLLTEKESLEKAFTILAQLEIQICFGIQTLGHLALHKITKLPINYLKINGNTIQGKIDEDNQNDAILHMLVTVSKDMNIKILAEKVENEKQKNLLQELGYDIMQGALFGSSLPVEKVI